MLKIILTKIQGKISKRDSRISKKETLGVQLPLGIQGLKTRLLPLYKCAGGRQVEKRKRLQCPEHLSLYVIALLNTKIVNLCIPFIIMRSQKTGDIKHYFISEFLI